MNPSQTAELDVSVVLPCLNEEESVALCVTQAREAIHRAGWSGEVVVVDNGSTDRSAELAYEAGARVVNEPTPGYGAALLRGIHEARGDVVVMADADATYSLDQLEIVAGPVLAGETDLMIAGRLRHVGRDSMPFLHRFVGTPALTWLVHAGTNNGIRLSDSQSGFRAFQRQLPEQLGLRSTGMEFASEMLIRAAQRGTRVDEVDLEYRVRAGESKLATWRDGLRHLRLILKLSPHLMLWHPGIAMLAMGVAIYAFSIATRQTPIGAHAWQPLFLGTILLVLGLVASLTGALLARYSPTASPSTRSIFAWISERRVVRRLAGTGVAVGLIGLVLDLVLFVVWVRGVSLALETRLYVSGIAQGLILFGALLAAAMGVHLVILASHGSDKPKDIAYADTRTV